MANRESLMNALIKLECTPTTYSRELLRKNWVEALTTAEFDPCDRLDGRTARKELSLYDAMMAEIYAEHDGSKARVRNRRSERRNHMAESWEAEKDRRKDMHWNHLVKKSRRDAGSKYGNHWASNAERKICKAEQITREDYEIELRNIAEDAERNAIEAEIRGWELMHAVEQANARAWMAMQEWLEWA